MKAAGAALALCLLAMMAGCATQPSYLSRATPEDIARCQRAKNGCTVWTDEEVNGYTEYLVNEVLRQLGVQQRGTGV